MSVWGMSAAKSASKRRWRIRKTASWRVPVCDACDRVTSQKTGYYRPTTSPANTGVSDCATNSAATAPCSTPTRETWSPWSMSVWGVSSCNFIKPSCKMQKKRTYPPDNHPRTFDMSGDILACLGHTDDWHYFEPCTGMVKLQQLPSMKYEARECSRGSRGSRFPFYVRRQFLKV